MCEENYIPKCVVFDKKGKFTDIAGWADSLYQFYKTPHALTSYYAKDKSNSKFYLLNYDSKGDDKCAELSIGKYSELDLEKELVEISATEVEEVLLNSFFTFVNKQVK